MNKTIGACIALGAGIGVLGGATWIALGAGIGLVVGTAIQAASKAKDKDSS